MPAFVSALALLGACGSSRSNASGTAGTGGQNDLANCPENTAGTAGASDAPGSLVTYSPPGVGQAWTLESADPLNATTPALLAVPGGVVVAGATADPAVAGLSAFASGVEAEAFLARFDDAGQALWRKPLTLAGLPWAVERVCDDVIVVAPYLPTVGQISRGAIAEEILLARYSADGAVRWERHLSFDHEATFAYGLAIDTSGAIYLAGGYLEGDSSGGAATHPLLVKCDPQGVKLWEKTFVHTGDSGAANAVAVLADGDLILTGIFDADLSFGGATTTLSTTALDASQSSGFLARFAADGEPVWSSVFGSDVLSIGMALTALPGGDFVLGGSVGLDLRFGGLTIPGVPSNGAVNPPLGAFVARVSADGAPTWITLDIDAEYTEAIATDGPGTLLLAGRLNRTLGSGGGAYLRSYDLTTGEKMQVITAPAGDGLYTTAVAPGAGSVWLAGRYASNVDFGNQNLLTSANAGVFLTRLASE